MPRFVDALLWMPFSAAVVWWSARLARASIGWWRRLPLHLAAAIGVATLHVAASRTAGIVPEQPRFVVVLFLNDMAIYLALAAVTHAWNLRRSAWNEALRAAGLERELMEARMEGLRWRLQPELPLAALEEVRRLAGTDADRADRLAARLGDLLRRMLRREGANRGTARR